MNKLINSQERMVPEMLEGYLSLNPDLYCKVPGVMGIKNKREENKVSVVIAGGSGNEPWVLGFVGDGLADGAALGNIYTAPPSRTVLEVTRSVPHDKGVIFIAANHAGDVLNFELVRELAELEGIKSHCIYVSDDISSAPLEKKEERRGIAGISFVVKIAGAASKEGYGLEEMKRVVEKAGKNTRTFGVTTSPGYMPGSGKAMCELPDGFVEFGMGFNGEPGIKREELSSADEITEALMEQLLNEVPAGCEAAFMVNGYGFTSMLELCIVSRKVSEMAQSNGIVNVHSFIDTLFSPQGTGGFSVSILILDDELKELYQKPCKSPLFRFQGGSR